MRKNSHHQTYYTDAVAPSLTGVWAYSPRLDTWEYILYASKEGFEVMNEHGVAYVHKRPLEIEALSPVRVEGTNRQNYIERLAYVRAEAGWAI